MTHLRKMMLEELRRRHYSEATTRRYIRFIERFAQHFHRLTAFSNARPQSSCSAPPAHQGRASEKALA